MIIDAFKTISSKAPCSYFTNCYNISTLNPLRILSSKCKLSSLSGNFCYKIPILWNSFVNISTIKSMSLCGLKTFKRSLKLFFLNMQNSYDSGSWCGLNNDLVSYCTYLSSQCLTPVANQPRLVH